MRDVRAALRSLTLPARLWLAGEPGASATGGKTGAHRPNNPHDAPQGSYAATFRPRLRGMNRAALPPLLPLAFAVLFTAGCDAPLSLSQQLEGAWVGRPESAAERVIREWPTRDADPNDPEIAQAAAETPPTDLEAFAGVRVELELDDAGKARLTLAGEQPLAGEWSLPLVEGRRGVLEIQVERGEVDGKPTFETRRFDIEVLKPTDGEGFVLREQNADRRFGRLLFRRPGDQVTPAATATPTPEATPEATP